MAAAKSKIATPDSDIPPNPKSSGKQPEEDGADDGDEVDEEDEEYTVEKVVSHAFDEESGLLLYEVKWEDYEERTWEPIENLEGLVELNAYHKRIGGPPKRKEKAVPPTSNSGSGTSNKKRKLEEASTPISVPKGKGGRGRTKDNSSNSTPKPTGATLSGSPDSSMPPKGTWENDVVAIQTITQDPDDGKIKVWVHWRSGARSVHDSKVVNQKCPQKMLEFYEAHLRFMPGPASKQIMDASGDKIATDEHPSSKDLDTSPKAMSTDHPRFKAEEDGDEEEDIGVKGVVTGGVKDVAMTG